MPTSFTELAPSYNTAFQRRNTLEWLPRWFEGYYSDDILRKLHYLLLVSQKDLVEESTKSLWPKFHGVSSSNRLAFIALYYKNSIVSPNIELRHPGVALSVRVVPDRGTFLIENKDPIALLEQGTIFFRNIANHTFLASSTSGFVDLTTTVVSGLVTDSYLLLENSLGDQYRYDPKSFLITPTSIFTGDEGIEYLVTYQNQARLNALLTPNSSSYILIDGERVELKPYQLENDWDEYLRYFQLKRKTRETNSSLKARCQYLSQSRTSLQKIAASLGTCAFYYWTLSDTLNVSALSFKEEISKTLPESIYITETPVKVGNSFYCSYPVSSAMVFVKQRPLKEDEFTLSAGVITLNSNIEYEEADFKVNYRHNNYQTTTVSGNISTLTSTSKGTHLFLFARKVEFGPVGGKIKKFTWQVPAQIVKDSAVFE